jgi:hypothetical protein
MSDPELTSLPKGEPRGRARKVMLVLAGIVLGQVVLY